MVSSSTTNSIKHNEELFISSSVQQLEGLQHEILQRIKSIEDQQLWLAFYLDKILEHYTEL